MNTHVALSKPASRGVLRQLVVDGLDPNTILVSVRQMREQDGIQTYFKHSKPATYISTDSKRKPSKQALFAKVALLEAPRPHIAMGAVDVRIGRIQRIASVSMGS